MRGGQWRAAVQAGLRRLRNAPEGRIRHQVQRIGVRKELPQREAHLAALVRLQGSRIDGHIPRPRAEADVGLVDQRGTEDVLVAQNIQPPFVDVVLLDLRPIDAVQRALRLGAAVREAERKQVARTQVIVRLERLGALRRVLHVLVDVVVIASREAPVELVGLGKHVQQGGAARLQPVRRNHIAGKRQLVGGVPHHNQLVVHVQRLRKVAFALDRGRHGALRQRLRHPLRPQLLRPEEEQLLSVPVELLRNEYRTAHVVIPRVVAVGSLHQAQPVIEEAVGVELLVALPVGAQAVEIAGPGLADQLYVRAGKPPILGLIVARKHLDFGHRVHADVHHGVEFVADGIQRGAVQRHVVGVLPAAQHTRQEPEQRHHVAPADG